jgi:Holliday junction resolvasome RuvABC DNA-binding subunit
MDRDVEQVLATLPQAPLADEIVATLAAVVSNTSAPDSATRALEKSRQASVAPEQRAAAAALQAYGVQCAADVFTQGLDPQATERAEQLRDALEAESAKDALALLTSTPDVGAEFKSRMCLAVAGKCAELVAAEIERAKKGPITILNEDDAKVFEERHAEHQQQRRRAAIDFLGSIPTRFPSFGATLFGEIRADVERHIGEKYKRPDIHQAVAALFDDALAAMQPSMRAQVAGHGQSGKKPS